MNARPVQRLLIASSTLAALATASASPLLEDPVSACETINCGAMTLPGDVRKQVPFVIQVFAAKGECLRIDVTAASDDLAMNVTSPDPYYSYFNDDRVEGDSRPLITVDPVDGTGWHTIIINHWDAAEVSASFTLRYGRYPTGNVNCPPPAL